MNVTTHSTVDKTKIRMDPNDRDRNTDKQPVEYVFEPFVVPEQNFDDSSSSSDDEIAPPSDQSSHTDTNNTTDSQPQPDQSTSQSEPPSTQPVSDPTLTSPKPSQPTYPISTSSQIAQISTHNPLLRRLFVLTIVEINCGEPTPKVSTFTWAFSSQFRMFVRVIMKMLEIARTRHEDPFDVFEEDELIGEDVSTLLDFEPICSGQNGYHEDIPEDKMEELIQMQSRVAKYFQLNNNIHSGAYHSFTLTRHIINDIERKTFTRDLDNLQRVEPEQIRSFFQ